MTPYHVHVEFRPCGHTALFLADEYQTMPLVCGECLEAVEVVLDA